MNVKTQVFITMLSMGQIATMASAATHSTQKSQAPKTVAAQIITVGHAQDNNCDYNDIQSAIDDPIEDTEIRVTHTAISLSGITLDNPAIVKLAGGYNSCQDAIDDISPPESQYSEISDPSRPGMGINMTQAVNFGSGDPLDLEISGFDINNSLGGIEVNYNGAGGNFYIQFNRLKIHDNSQRGVNLDGEGLVVTLNHTEIYNNSNLIGGSTQGGGIRCRNANLIMQPLTAIYNNSSDIGAGIYASGCEVEIHAGGLFNELTETGIFRNTANDYGAGVAAFNSTVNGFGSYEHPLRIHHNEAPNPSIGGGAGVYLGPGAVVNLENALIEFNTAGYRGGGVATLYFGMDLPAPIFNMGRREGGCSYASMCSSLSHNTLTSSFGIGGAVNIRYNATLSINQTEIAYNKAAKTSGIDAFGEGAILSMEGNLIHHNGSHIAGEQADQLFDIYSYDDPVSVNLSFTTIADNGVDTVFRIEYNNNLPQNFEVYNSIIYNPGSQIVDPDGGEGEHDANMDCSLVHDFSTAGMEGNGTQVGDPLFYGNMNYQLQANSPAIDPACSSDNNPIYTDIIGTDRTADTSADLGSYETVVFDTVIFANDFE